MMMNASVVVQRFTGSMDRAERSRGMVQTSKKWRVGVHVYLEKTNKYFVYTHY